jgi:hypothetical protein
VVLLSDRNEPEPYRTALAIGALFMHDAPRAEAATPP